ncbi:ankyrin repeat and fibronectin type-III domain-containing protein 1 isoform X2 [Electrophorus electricus]|uniref:ankyrin repeat and fibronectin type-III domain-containing protein 1 isoform X2 n=1 Tax=Electrophorus electricus TaxID=8005 RepID=UPI0015D06B2D|nr:ankyrin repeat and fibronectin type-III domain-containing protein 1 isoform X2 [Electrophorus electricus]
MTSFGKLTDYLTRRRSRDELISWREGRRSGSYCCTVAEARSLERRLQRPLLAKSRTLPSIPQSPLIGRVHQHSHVIRGNPPHTRLPSSPAHLSACTLPTAGDAWQLEDDNEGARHREGPGVVEPRPRSQSPFSHFRSRAAYLRKSVSVDDQLGGSEFDSAHTEGRSSRSGKGKLKRKFSLGSADRKEARQRRVNSGLVRLTQRLSLKDRPWKQEKSLLRSSPIYRRRSLSVDWVESKMAHQIQETQPQMTRKYPNVSGSSPPSAARRFYRNLSGKFRTGNPGLDDPTSAADKEPACKTSVHSSRALFEAVEQQVLGSVESLLSKFTVDELDLNTPNSEGLLPLDIAILTNNAPIAKTLLRAGAKESPHFVSPEGRAAHLAALVQEAELRVSELTAQVSGEGPGAGEESDKERQLKGWEWRLRLYKRMQTGCTHASPPDPPSSVCVCVSSCSSLTVHFQEPLCLNATVVTKYRVVWSSSPSFSPLLGEILIEDMTQLQCEITGLQSGLYYHVQVFAYNMKGWSSPQISVPACATPSSWRDVDSRAKRLHGLTEALEGILGQIKELHQHCLCHDQCKGPSNVRKHSVSKTLRHLFQPSSKFVKNLKRGLYVACVFYREDNILVTAEDQLPVAEVDESYTSRTQDFLWFTKVTYLWEELTWLLQCVSPTQLSCSCTLQTRLKILQTLRQLQTLLGTQDLGQVYVEPEMDHHGNTVLVLIKELRDCSGLEGLHWSPLSRVQLQHTHPPSEHTTATALDTLITTLHEKLTYHRRCSKQLSPGLYLGYVKFCTSVEQIRVLVSHKLPNVFCHVKLRDNSHVSREEWQWLRSVRSLDDTQKLCADEQSAPHRLLLELRHAAKELLRHINIPNNQALDFRVYIQEVIEFGEGVSFLLLLPPCEEVCTPPGHSSPYSPLSGSFTLPLQVFELVNFETYCPRFINQYCRASAILGLESLLSQQALREAFSEAELLSAKQKHHKVQELLQQMEQVWREARWMVQVLQCARYRQQPAGVSLSSIMDFTKEREPPPPSTSSQLDYLPSPGPSPDTGRKHPDVHSLSDEDEGSLQVFLTPESDYSSSRDQTPPDPDLLPPESPSHTSAHIHTSTYSHTTVHTDPSQPDVLQTGGGIRTGLEMIDSDFILPSRQIELLRITEKRTALCVRTSSLEYPPPVSMGTVSPNASPLKKWTCPSSGGCCCPPSEPGFRPVRTLSDHSRTHHLSALSPNTLRSCYTTLRVYPQYRTGLPRETSVKLRVTLETPAREMVHLVVQEINSICAQLRNTAQQCVCTTESCADPAQACVCGSDMCVYGAEQLQHFALVLVMDGRERWLQDDLCPLTLQNPWTQGKLCVRFKQYSPLALQNSHTTTV